MVTWGPLGTGAAERGNLKARRLVDVCISVRFVWLLGVVVCEELLRALCKGGRF